MKIRDAIQPDLVFLGLEAEDAESAIDVMARELSAASRLDAVMVKSALIERERLGSTSVGNGFAIPHCKLQDLGEIVVALARFDEGVDFGDANKHAAARFFFLVLSPPDQPAEHLQVLSQIARILKNADLRKELLDATDVESIATAIQRAAEQEGL
jgi:mannitol/fructose-specific phosphotransferase system IIA component (Ntr-type)